jgi:hypothetical protein
MSIFICSGFGSHHPVFTCATIGDQVFNQGIIQSDTLKGSNKDTPMIPDGTGEYF